MNESKRDIPVDMFEKNNNLRVIAELPEVNEEDIMLDLNQDMLVISASHGKQNYRKMIKLPRISENIIRKIYNNGILEITLKLTPLHSGKP